MSEKIKITHDGAVALITLSHPPHNLIGGDFLNAYCDALEAAARNQARAILIRSDLRHFCAGADVAALADERPSNAAHETLARLEGVRVPTVAAVHGAVLGGGFELALACDFIVAAQSAQIGSVEVGIGLVPLLGAIPRLVERCGAARAKEITMLGRRYKPDVLERWGAINLVVPDDELPSASLSLARQLAAGPTVALGCIKDIVTIAVREGTQAADEALADKLNPMWESNDFKRGSEAMGTTGPGTAIFEGD
ncbi:MAG: enoyl-CoA hydratase/isomerase family protein [Pseudomonadota bacterium]